MKNVFIYIGMALLILASAIASFTGLDVALWLTLATAAATLAGTIITMINKAPDKKDWKLYTSIACMVIGVILLVFAGVTPDKIKSLITAIIGVVGLILSVILPNIKKSK